MKNVKRLTTKNRISIALLSIAAVSEDNDTMTSTHEYSRMVFPS